jgi:hypothetical protein
MEPTNHRKSVVTVGIMLEHTLCQVPSGGLADARPIVGRVSIVNHIFANGHKVIILTAYPKDQDALVEGKIMEWGLDYDRIEYSFPKMDIFVGAQAVRPGDLFGFGELNGEEQTLLQSVFLSTDT